MNGIAGWRIQVCPQYSFSDLSACEFFNVPIANDAAAVAAIRNRTDAIPGERVYAVRPLSVEELNETAAPIALQKPDSLDAAV